MPTTTLTPDQFDRQAARLHDTEAWQQIVTGCIIVAAVALDRIRSAHGGTGT